MRALDCDEVDLLAVDGSALAHEVDLRGVAREGDRLLLALDVVGDLLAAAAELVGRQFPDLDLVAGLHVTQHLAPRGKRTRVKD